MVRTSDPAPLASSMERKSRRAVRYILSGFLIEVGVPMVPSCASCHQSGSCLKYGLDRASKTVAALCAPFSATAN